MGKQPPKMSARVVGAIQNLKEAHGSTPKEIMNYITSQCSGSESSIQRQMNAALKRGLEYGILKKSDDGHYFLNTSIDLSQIATALEPAMRSRRRPRRRTGRSRARRGRRRSRRSRRSKRRRRSRGRRRARKGRGRRRGRGRVRAVGAKRLGSARCSCNSKRVKDVQLLRNTPVEQNDRENMPGDHEIIHDADRRGGRSKSRDRSLTRSGSSANSDREVGDDRQMDPDQD